MKDALERKISKLESQFESLRRMQANTDKMIDIVIMLFREMGVVPPEETAEQVEEKEVEINVINDHR